jgi:hypothetical protein
VPPSEQLIVFAGKQLMNGFHLSHYMLVPGSTVHLTGRLPAGTGAKRAKLDTPTDFTPLASCPSHPRCASDEEHQDRFFPRQDEQG